MKKVGLLSDSSDSVQVFEQSDVTGFFISSSQDFAHCNLHEKTLIYIAPLRSKDLPSLLWVTCKGYKASSYAYQVQIVMRISNELSNFSRRKKGTRPDPI